jgi:hypothetical protein
MNAACVVETYLRGDEEDVSAFAAAATGTAESAIVLHPPWPFDTGHGRRFRLFRAQGIILRA